MNMPERFDRLTPEARKVLSLAHEEAQRFNHNYIGTEHLLLGLTRLEEGVSATVLKNLGVELDKVRGTVEFIIGRGDRVVLGEIGLTPRSKQVIELAFDEASRLQQEEVGPEHVLLGLVREREGIAAGVLESLGVNLQKVRQATYRALGKSSPAGEPEEEPGITPTAGTHIGTQIHFTVHSPEAETLFSIGAANALPPMITQSGLAERYRPWHIDAEQPQKTPVGKGATLTPIPAAQQGIASGTLLGWVIVNTGGAFTLTLYDGLAADAPSLAIISHPPTGACFPFHCLIKHGLAYTLEGTPGSVTIIYHDARE
jgi:hypothetical protein